MVIARLTILLAVRCFGGYERHVPFVIYACFIGLVRGRCQVLRAYYASSVYGSSERYPCVDLTIATGLDFIACSSWEGTRGQFLGEADRELHGEDFAYSQESRRAGSQTFPLLYRYSSDRRFRSSFFRLFRSVVVYLWGLFYVISVYVVFNAFVPQRLRSYLGVDASRSVFYLEASHILGPSGFLVGLFFCLF